MLRPRSTAEENSAKIAGRSTEIDQPAAGTEREHAAAAGSPEDRVDHDVDRSAGRLDQPPGESGPLLGRVQHDHVVAPARPGSFGGCCRPADRDQSRGAALAGHGQRHLAHRAVGSEHDHPLAGRKSGPPGQRHPRRDPRRADRRHLLVGNVRGDRHQVGGGTAAHSARLPSTGFIPALVANQTRVPGCMIR